MYVRPETLYCGYAVLILIPLETKSTPILDACELPSNSAPPFTSCNSNSKSVKLNGFLVPSKILQDEPEDPVSLTIK